MLGKADVDFCISVLHSYRCLFHVKEMLDRDWPLTCLFTIVIISCALLVLDGFMRTMNFLSCVMRQGCAFWVIVGAGSDLQQPCVFVAHF